MRFRALLVATVMLLLVSGVMATPHSMRCGEATAFAAPQRPYVAFRRLEAKNLRSGRQALKPGRKGDVGLLFGNMFLQPDTGDLVRVEGRLAKSPSFWVSQVDISWTYARVHNDVVLPVSLHSVAKVKMFGPSTFDMTYDYRSVDGQAVSTGSRASR